MKKTLIIGAGGVGRVVAHKCAQLSQDVFGEIMLASRTKSRCDAIAADILAKKGHQIRTGSVDADDVAATVRLLQEFKPDILINVALPYQDLTLMDACLEAGVDYVDTANYEPRDVPKFEYHWQWAYQERFQEAGLTALLGSGFDPGVTNVFCAHAKKHHFDTIDTLDIVDCNAGSNGLPFATNFNPEINIREVTAKGRFWENGAWQETDPISVGTTFDFPGVGPKKMYLLYHEELESLSKHYPEARRMRFWMTFSDNYLTHLRVLEGIGMTSITPIKFQGQDIIPLEFLKAVLPDPGSLGALTKGKTCIGDVISGVKDGKVKHYFIWNECDHEECYAETGAQGVSYTTGVPAMIGAKQILEGTWKKPGVWNMEQHDPDPFMRDLNLYGLPWQEKVMDHNPLASVG
jgi:saccharopine dehydrogenase (NAD+, L-lysine-forming)